MNAICARKLVLILAAALAWPAPPAPGQSELVIVRTDKKEEVYHQAGCSSIKGVKDVVALGRAKAESRGLKQHDGCDPAKAESAKGEKDESITVYVDSSKYYHKKDCPKLEKDAKKANLEDAGKKLWPCPACRPPIRKRKPGGNGDRD